MFLKNYLLIVGIFLLSMMGILQTNATQTNLEYTGDFYELGDPKNIFKHNICQRVTKIGSGNNIFIPLKTPAEWNAFISHHPTSSVQVAPCSCLGTTISGYTVPALNHNETRGFTRNQSIINGTQTYSSTASCNGGVVTMSLETISNISCNSGYTQSGNSCIEIITHCPSGSSVGGYTLTSQLNNGSTRTQQRTVTGTPSNGSTLYTGTLRCANGSLSVTETSSVNCNSGYSWSGGACVANPVQPINCPAGSINSGIYSGVNYSYASINHGNTRGVNTSQTIPNGTRNYSGTANCNNGSVTLTNQTTSVSCNSGYSWNGSSCVANQVITYSYSYGSWSSCSANPSWGAWSTCSNGSQTRTCQNTNGTQSRSASCIRSSDGAVVLNSNCGTSTTSQSCSSTCSGSNTQSCPQKRHAGWNKYLWAEVMWNSDYHCDYSLPTGGEENKYYNLSGQQTNTLCNAGETMEIGPEVSYYQNNSLPSNVSKYEYPGFVNCAGFDTNYRMRVYEVYCVSGK